MKSIINKKRILHIQLLPLLSGVQNVMLNLITNLDSDEFEFSVISAPDGPLVNKLKELKIKHYQVPGLVRKISLKDLFVLIRIYKICRMGKFDIVHTHSSKTGFIGRISARFAGIKVVIHTIHGFPFNPFQPLPKQIFFELLEKIAAFFCDRAISVNKTERQLAIEKHIIPEKKILTIYNGIGEASPHSEIFREEFGFHKDDKIFGSVCRFSKQKNIISMIKIAIEIVEANDKIKFVFIGDGELWEDVKRMVRAKNLSAEILLPGWKSNVADWLAFFDVFVLYSLWEGLSLSILEAMSAGLPIIASDIKGNNELVKNGYNGFLVKIGNKDSFVKNILWISTHDRERDEMGKNSLKLVREKFALNRFIESYKNLYINLYQSKL